MVALRRRRPLLFGTAFCIVFLGFVFVFLALAGSSKRHSETNDLYRMVDLVISNALQTGRGSTSLTTLPFYREHFASSVNVSPKLDLSLSAICPSLASQMLLFVGSSSTYHLHLRLLSLTTDSGSCYGIDACAFHHICLNSSFVYSSPASKPPSKEELIASGSTLLLYRRADTAHPYPPDLNDGPVVDPETGVRVKNVPWLNTARGADVLVIGRAPVPAPAWTWGEGWEKAWAGLVGEAVARKGPRQGKVARKAVDDTVGRWMLEVSETLEALKRLSQKTRIVWHSEPLWENVTLGSLLDEPGRRTRKPWRVYHDVQGVHCAPFPLFMTSYPTQSISKIVF